MNVPSVAVADPKIVQSLFTENNIYFDKHPMVANLTNRLMGSSILFAHTN